MNKLAYQVATVTDKGLLRSDNRDNLYVSADKRLFVVANGFAKDGAEGSRIAVTTLDSRWNDAKPILSDDAQIKDWLQISIETANKEIVNQNRGLGSTIVSAVQSDHNKVHIAHVGDSRAYVMRHGTFTQVTEDHTLVNEMLKRGIMTAEQLANSHCCYAPRLLRCLGYEENVSIDSTEVELGPGDWLVLCTDGLLVDAESISQILSDSTCPEEACNKLLASTMEAGAHDNVTIIAVQYRSESDAD